MPTFLNGPDAQTTKIDSEEGHELKGKPEQEPIEQTSNEQPINGQLPSEQIPNEQEHPENGSGSAVTSISTEVANYDVIAAAVASAHDAAFNKGETTPPPILSGLNGVAQPQVLPEGDKKDLTGKATYPEGAVPITHDEQAKVNPIQGTNGVVHKMQDTRKVLQCPKCPSTFYSKSGYYRHVKKCGEAKAHLRKMCHQYPAQNSRAPIFTRPVLHPSVIQEDKSSSRITYKCPQCPSDFFSKSGFYKHIKRCKAAKLH